MSPTANSKCSVPSHSIQNGTIRGRIQRSCVQTLSDANEYLDSIEIAGRVFDKMQITEAEHVSVRRALRLLCERKLLIDMGRGWRDGRKRWATPDVAQAYYARVRAAFGERGRVR